MSVLGILGVDVALLGRVNHRDPLRPDETVAFYQLLSGMRSTTGSELVGWAQRHMPRHVATWKEYAGGADPAQQALAREVLRVAEGDRYSVAPFFNVPGTQVGNLAVFDGVVRRAIRVEVGDDLDAMHFGIDHYYELALFTDDSQNNPLMFAVLEVPSELPLGDDVRLPVRVAGFFFKGWRYTSRQSETTGGETLRVAPLFVGRAPLRLIPLPKQPTWGWVVGLGFIGLVAVLWISAWRRTRSDRAFANSTLARLQRPTDPVEIDVDQLPHDSE